MSSLPLGFLAPWQPKHDSLRMGATSLMKLTGPVAALTGGADAWAAGGVIVARKKASAAARTAQTMQKQKRDRSMGKSAPGSYQVVRDWVAVLLDDQWLKRNSRL